MEITHSKNPKLDYYIKTDYYPYTESKEIIKSLAQPMVSNEMYDFILPSGV